MAKSIINMTNYHARTLPKFRFTQDYTVDNSVLYLKGEEYDTYMWSFSRLVELLSKNILIREEQK